MDLICEEEDRSWGAVVEKTRDACVSNALMMSCNSWDDGLFNLDSDWLTGEPMADENVRLCGRSWWNLFCWLVVNARHVDDADHVMNDWHRPMMTSRLSVCLSQVTMKRTRSATSVTGSVPRVSDRIPTTVYHVIIPSKWFTVRTILYFLRVGSSEENSNETCEHFGL